MKVIAKKDELSGFIKEAGLSPVGFVPTMGALHQGHISLVENAVSQCPLAVVSIYVNPTQFNDKNDLRNYPRCLPDDLKLLAGAMRENDVVFTPDDREMYPEEDKRVFDFGNLGNVMEALHRPGHFNGVAQVVSKLFDIVNPDIAFFGQKDFQQVAVIRELVRQNGYKVEIIACPIVREKDGLAMSSRNQLLEPQIRLDAPVIYSSISAAAEKITASDIPSLKNKVKRDIEKKEGFKVEYFEIVDDRELIPVASRKEMQPGKRYFGCIAVKAGRIRLIDNIEIPL
jgi:pantoate--beta-alanine ligase